MQREDKRGEERKGEEKRREEGWHYLIASKSRVSQCIRHEVHSDISEYQEVNAS